MALIECPECDKSVSEMADACPSCGYRLARKGARDTRIRSGLVILAICLGLFGAIIGFTIGNPVFGAVGVVAVLVGVIKLAV